MKIEEILEKYSKREITLGRAAKMAEMPLADFMKLAADEGILLNYSVESLKEDFLAAIK